MARKSRDWAEAYISTPHKQARRLTQPWRKRTVSGWKLACSLTCAISLLATAAASAGGLDPSLAKHLAGVSAETEIQVIIRLKAQPDRNSIKKTVAGKARQERTTQVVRILKETADRSQSGMKAALSRETAAGKVKKSTPFWIFNGFAVTATAETIQRLAALDDVAEITPNRIITLVVPSPSAVPVASWNLAQIGAPQLWASGFTGQGTVVASLDTGVDVHHPAIGSKWRGGSNSWFDPYRHTTSPYDLNGHGTAVTGLMIGGNTSDNATGVAPGARWIAAKIFDDNDAADLAGIHAAFQWVFDPDGDPATHDSPDVVNNSWEIDNTVGIYDNEFQPDIDLLRAAGIAVVFAAGNEQAGALPGTSTSPGNNRGAFAVGASDNKGTIAYFGSRGPSASDGSIYPALAAPGINVRSTDLYGGYAGFTGTSFAAPHVSGAIALLKSAVSGVTLQQVEEALTNSVVGQAGPDNTYGYGKLDVNRAYAYLANPGDVDGDGKITMADVLILLNAVIDERQRTPLIVRNGDVSPLGLDGKPDRDGNLGMADALLELQRVLGITSW